MGYAVLHLKKASGNACAMSAHIERTVDPPNADPTRTYLNRELITFPEGVANRTEAINYRLENAGLTRKIGKNQVKAIIISLSGSREDMSRIEKEGKLGEWCDTNLQWLTDTFGKENVVSAVLHRDETSPHIHATVVPIVTGERRKAKTEENKGKKKYKKKNPNRVRLCCDDVMARDKLESYQDSYAMYMQPYGLQRGVRGSEARHIDTNDYYRKIFKEIKELEKQVSQLRKVEHELQTNIQGLETKEKFEKMKGNVLTTLGNLFSSSKFDHLKEENEELKKELDIFQREINQLKHTLVTNKEEMEKEAEKYIRLIKHIYQRFPDIKNLLDLEKQCNKLALTDQQYQKLTTGEPMLFTGNLYSETYRCYFAVKDISLQIVRNPKTKKLDLTIDRMKIDNWFKEKYQANKIQSPLKKKGRRL
ncbi:MAG: plasmid recombination protein [Tannerellaceae bacterium]|nr:plasmid recombination protein [Tannerellaceae bacterium]